MIRYALNCEQGHSFESWFQNSAAYDKQARRGLVNCPVCGSAKVEKAIMAPRLARSDIGDSAATRSPLPAQPIEPTAPPAPVTGGPASSPPAAPVATGKAAVAMMSPPERELRRRLRELRDHVTKNAHYVGPRFPDEARKMHYGEVEHRSIYGEATSEDAKALHEEGIEFHPLPVLPDEFN